MIKSRQFVNIDVVNPVSDTRSFMYDFFDGSAFDTAEFTHHFLQLLNELTKDGLSVTGVTSDGRLFQQKA